jgi:acetyl esterase
MMGASHESSEFFPGTTMRLDPELQRDLLAKLIPDAPPVSALTVDAARATAVIVEPTEPIAETRDLEATGPHGPISLRLYQPLENRGPGVVVFYHGGGWVLSTIGEYEDSCRRLANTVGRTVIAVEYRRAPEHKFPAGVEDCYAALTWIAQHTGDLGVDARPFVVAGDSAGGNLAAVVSYLARERGGPHLQAQILIYPVASFDVETESIRTAQAGPWLAPPDMLWFRNHYLRSDEDERNPQAAPLLIEDLSGLPPALIITAQYDPLRDGGREYAVRLIRAGVSVRYREYTGTVHGFLGNFREVQVARDAFREIGAFLCAGY